jgi:tRNA-modifying protein YgfZ
MVSNDVEALEPGGVCEALLLTAKARIVAPMIVLRRADVDFLLLTEPEAGERLTAALLRSRFAAQCTIEQVEHSSTLVIGAELPGAIRNADYGVPACEVLDGDVEAQPITAPELERLRIRARTPVLGRELDDRVLPAEAGLEERAISFTKGCYPGQEPVARLHYRGHPNRGLRVLSLAGPLPETETELTLDGKAVGRITSAAPEEDGVVALAYVRREVPEDAVLLLPDGRSAHQS